MKTEIAPVFSRLVVSDVCVSNWQLYGWFNSPRELSEWLEEKLEPAPVFTTRHMRPAWQTARGDFQFLFVFDWDPEMLKRDHRPLEL